VRTRQRTLRIALDLPQSFAQLVVHRRGERIEAIRPVQGERGDPAGDLE
jgi:hypothetical protein